MEIQELQNELHQFKAKDVNLIVITPQPSSINAEWQQQQNAEFEILSDKGNLLAKNWESILSYKSLLFLITNPWE